MGRRPPVHRLAAPAGLVPQVLKADVRDRITGAALRCFAEQGYAGTSVAAIAAAAGTAPGNVYRYVTSKEALFDAVVPAALAQRHDELLDTRVAALAEAGADPSPAAAELLEFWLDHRLEVVVLLDRAEGTPFADYPERFVQRLVAHAEAALPGPPSPVRREVLHLVFDGTRRTLARILATARDRDHARELVAAFWSYQLPGLEGLRAHLAAAGPDAPRG